MRVWFVSNIDHWQRILHWLTSFYWTFSMWRRKDMRTLKFYVMCQPTATNAADVPIDLKKNLWKREKREWEEVLRFQTRILNTLKYVYIESTYVWQRYNVGTFFYEDAQFKVWNDWMLFWTVVVWFSFSFKPKKMFLCFHLQSFTSLVVFCYNFS